MSIRFDGKVVVVTGGGNGIGREHCLQFASLGAKVAILDRGVGLHGEAEATNPAELLAQEITQSGGTALACSADVTRPEEVEAAVAVIADQLGPIDSLVTNAGILRDKSFAKAEMDDVRLVMEVHYFGTVNCIRAVWPIMRDQGYGRIVVTTSSSGLYGNFGQFAYGSAKLAVLGLMNTLAIEGARYGIHINAIAPSAMTRMNEALEPEDSVARDHLRPDQVSPAVLFLCSEAAPTRTIVGAGGGSYNVVRLVETVGAHIADANISADDIKTHWSSITRLEGAVVPQTAADQTRNLLKLAGLDY